MTFTWHGRTWTIYKRSTKPFAPWYFKINNTPLSLQTHAAAIAIQNAKLRLEQRALGADNYQKFLLATAKRATLTVRSLLADWKAAGCPTPRTETPSGRALTAAHYHIERLSEHFDTKHPGAITWDDLKTYATWRARTARQVAPASRGSVSASSPKHQAGRTVDLELTTLKAACQWAIRNKLLETNPLETRPKFAGPAIHCRDHQPASADELHTIAARLFAEPDTTVRGARVIFQGFTGLRCQEAVLLRRDARILGPARGEIGAIENGNLLHLARAKNGCNPYIQIHGALRAFLDCWLPHAAAAWPDSPWYFPDPNNPEVHDAPGALNKSIQKASDEGVHRTAHALRAFYAWVRRSQKATDGQIAAEMGLKSGAPLIITTYGAIPPNWHGGPELDWLPTKVPVAWSELKTPANIIAL